MSDDQIQGPQITETETGVPSGIGSEPMHVERIKGVSGHLVLLHGWGQSSAQLRTLAENLSTIANVHLVDLPGFGQSPPPPGGDWTTKAYADRIVGYLDEQGIDKADFLGHSFGGKISIQLGVHYPDRVRRIVLIGASGLKPPRTAREKARFKFIRALGKSLKWLEGHTGSSWYVKWFTPRFGSRDYLAAGVMRPTLVKSVNEDLTDAVPRVKAPTLLLWGADDRETPIATGRRYAELLPESRLITLPFKGHEPFSDIGSHLCGYYIRRFISDDRYFSLFDLDGAQ